MLSTLKIHLCPSHTGQVLRLPGAVSQDVLHVVSNWTTLTEVVGTAINTHIIHTIKDWLFYQKLTVAGNYVT